MKKNLRSGAGSLLIIFFVSLLIFSAAMPYFGTYLAMLCAVEWISILMYGKRDNYRFFLRVLPMLLGNVMAFTFLWLLLGRDISRSNLDTLEWILLILLLAGTLCIVCTIVFGKVKDRTQKARKKEAGSPSLFPERKYDLQRLNGSLQSGTPLIGLDSRWGNGKTFLIDQLCASPQVNKDYEVIRINVLAGHENEVELTLMNEFDRMMRQDHIFSQASKQMIKSLESNDTLKQLQWLLIEDTQSVSTTFSCVLNDLEKLDKKVLIIVDDIERLGDESLIRKLFALMESISSPKVQIVYLFNSQMLTGFDRDYLEKYIPRYMYLTPISFSSIVREFWDELEMGTTEAVREDVEKMVEFPDSSYSITSILALDVVRSLKPFHLDNITVRRVRVFLEEFRDMIRMNSTSEGGGTSTFSKDERELLLKCLFIKHFLHDDFKTLVIGTSIVDCFSFQLNEEAKNILRGSDLQAPESVTLLGLFNIRRQLGSAEGMRLFMEEILMDDGNYDRLAALSMLDYSYTDIWQDICDKERTGAKRTAAAVDNGEWPDPLMTKAEQVGNEDISSIERVCHNERIDRVMWNLLANGASELTNYSAYVKRFRELVLAAAPSAQDEAWQEFLSDAFHGKIYKDNITRDRLCADKYLPLFQGFRVVNAEPEQWLGLIDFYFRREGEKGISVEMIQDLNYVDMMDRRVYISVLRAFSQCRIIGNLNSEPCMYRFLRLTLRVPSSLGYTTNYLFHDLWYLEDEPAGASRAIPSERWKKAVMELASRFDAMRSALERDKLGDPRLTRFDPDIDVIINFIDKCEALIAEERPIHMRRIRVEAKEARSVTRHQELCDTLWQELQSGMDADEWHKRVDSEYEKGNLDPLEVKKLIQMAGEIS